MKKCPYCEREIKDKALKCKHCKKHISQPAPKSDRGNGTGNRNESNSFAFEIVKAVKRGKKIFITLAILIGVPLVIFFWYVLIPTIIAVLIWWKTDWELKKKLIGTGVCVLLFGSLFGLNSYLNRNPSIEITKPNNGFTVQASKTTISGTVDPDDAPLTINGRNIPTTEGIFEHEVNLFDEENSFIIKASNGENSTSTSIIINREFTEEEIAERQRKKEEKEAERKAGIEARKKFVAEKEAKEAAVQREWETSKAGQWCADNPEWSRSECKKLADGRIWIGMTYDMLKYRWGLPDVANQSNYGYGTEWQWCWNDYEPSCFYGDSDLVIDSYN